MKHDFQFNMNSVSANVDWMKLQVIQSKNGIIINIGVSIKNKMIGILEKSVTCRILVRVIVSAINHVKLMNI